MNMKAVTIAFGYFSTLLALCLGAMFIVASCEAISANYAERERTAQVQIAETQATERTRINADAMVETYRIQSGAQVQVARIDADATKKTSIVFSVFYLLRVLVWLVGILAALWVAVLIKEGRLGKWGLS